MRKSKIVALWLVLMLGLIVHTMLEILPLFAGESIAVESQEVNSAMLTTFSAVIMFLIPVVGILFTLYARNRGTAIVALVIASLYGVANLLHMSDLFQEFSWGQCAVLPINLLINILLILEIVQLVKERGK